MYLCTDFRWWRANLISLCSWTHRCLQSCVGTQARLGYAGLVRNCSVFCHYTARYTYVCACVSTHMLYIGGWEHATCLRVRSSWYENTKEPGQCPGMPRPAGACGWTLVKYNHTTLQWWFSEYGTGTVEQLLHSLKVTHISSPIISFTLTNCSSSFMYCALSSCFGSNWSILPSSTAISKSNQ